jgi:hypothetical protein
MALKSIVEFKLEFELNFPQTEAIFSTVTGLDEVDNCICKEWHQGHFQISTCKMSR